MVLRHLLEEVENPNHRFDRRRAGARLRASRSPANGTVCPRTGTVFSRAAPMIRSTGTGALPKSAEAKSTCCPVQCSQQILRFRWERRPREESSRGVEMAPTRRQ